MSGRLDLRPLPPEPSVSWWLDLDHPSFYAAARQQFDRMRLSTFGRSHRLALGPNVLDAVEQRQRRKAQEPGIVWEDQ